MKLYSLSLFFLYLLLAGIKLYHKHTHTLSSLLRSKFQFQLRLHLAHKFTIYYGHAQKSFPVAPWATWTKCHYLNWKESIHQHVGNLVKNTYTLTYNKGLSMCEKKYATYNHNKKTVKVNLWKSPIYFHTSKNLFAAKSHSRLKLWMQQNHQCSRAKCKSKLQTSNIQTKTHCKASFPFWDGFLEGAILVPKMMSALPHPQLHPETAWRKLGLPSI